MQLFERIQDYVLRYWSADVRILSTWSTGPEKGYLVYRQKRDPKQTLGMRVELGPNAADGTLEGYAQDIAVQLAEPLGTAVSHIRQDGYGILWLGIPSTLPTPTPPREVLVQLGIEDDI